MGLPRHMAVTTLVANTQDKFNSSSGCDHNIHHQARVSGYVILVRSLQVVHTSGLGIRHSSSSSKRGSGQDNICHHSNSMSGCTCSSSNNNNINRACITGLLDLRSLACHQALDQVDPLTLSQHR